MERSPDEEKILKEMKPGTISGDGFLGTDLRSLPEILKQDGDVVARLGVTHKGIAEKMRAFRNSGMKGLGDFINVTPHFEVMVDSFRGKLPCPFGHQHHGAQPENTKGNHLYGHEHPPDCSTRILRGNRRSVPAGSGSARRNPRNQTGTIISEKERFQAIFML